jgi:DNA-binding MarR family transcriptional regulator
MRKASRRLTQLYDDALGQCGLRSTQYAILSELEGRWKEPPTMAQLAQALVTDRSALGHSLKPLERDGLIELVEGEADRRRKHVVLSAKGKAAVVKAKPHWQKAQNRFAEVFGASASADLRATLIGIAYDERLGELEH